MPSSSLGREPTRQLRTCAVENPVDGAVDKTVNNLMVCSCRRRQVTPYDRRDACVVYGLRRRLNERRRRSFTLRQLPSAFTPSSALPAIRQCEAALLVADVGPSWPTRGERICRTAPNVTRTGDESRSFGRSLPVAVAPQSIGTSAVLALPAFRFSVAGSGAEIPSWRIDITLARPAFPVSSSPHRCMTSQGHDPCTATLCPLAQSRKTSGPNQHPGIMAAGRAGRL